MRFVNPSPRSNSVLSTYNVHSPLLSLPPCPRRFCDSVAFSSFLPLLLQFSVMVSILPCTRRTYLTLLSIGVVKHTVLQVRLRRSLHRDTLFASGRKISMGTHLHRPARRRHKTTDAKIAFEAGISSWSWQFNTAFDFGSARVTCACCVCSA